MASVNSFAVQHYRFLVCVFLIPLVFPSDTDYSLECNPGYRVASFRRSATQNKVVGSLTIECEIIDTKSEQVFCERLQSVPQCSGVPEGCTGNTWIGGFHAYVIENITEAVLLEPICCTSKNVHIDEMSCIHDRINSALGKFDHFLAHDLIYRGLQCWHQYDNDNVLFDLIWKAEICSFISPNIPRRLKGCRECNCKCGIEQCPNQRYPIRIVHKHYSTSSCGCKCNCAYKCL